jgi:general secretion pathway protein G
MTSLTANGDAARRGFSLLELLIVLSIMATLLTLSMPRYFHAVDRSNEQVLAFNLNTMRVAIDQYFADHGKLPPDLNALIDKKYLREVPVDPVTGRSDTWILTAGGKAPHKGVADVRSGAAGTAPSGKAYAEL